MALLDGPGSETWEHDGPAASVTVAALYEGGAKVFAYPGPYHGSALVVRRGDTAEIRALTVQGGFTPAHWAAARDALQAERFAWADWERRTGDQVRLVRRAV